MNKVMSLRMKNIPFFHSYETASKKLTLRGAAYVPEQLRDMAQEVDILDASQGSMTDIPEWLPELELDVLFLSQNSFTSVPPVVGKCESLRVFGMKSCKIERVDEGSLPPNVEWLILTDNAITQMPEQLGGLVRLKKLALAGNQLRALPDLSPCREIEFLRIAANQLTAVPEWVPQLPQLTWYGDNGNPYSILSKPTVPAVELASLSLGEVINESPSSVVRHATRGDAPVILKHYKGGVVSDGYTEDDLRMSLSAPKQQQLVSACAAVERAGETVGILMDPLPDRCESLGLPPTLESCTRDTYPRDRTLSAEVIERILHDVELALQALHKSSIAHGDLYAHNIVFDPATGEAVLTDFGAATMFATEETWRTDADLRALAILQKELFALSK